MTELYDLTPKNMNIVLCQFSGGERKGLMLQIAPTKAEAGCGWIQLTKTEALALSSALFSWVTKNTKEKSNVR